MKRRNFLKIFSAGAVTPFVVNGHAMRPFANRRMASLLSTCEGVSDRTLVLIQLKGGNDGVNMIIPIAQYDDYANLRPYIRVPDSGLEKYITLDGTLAAPDQVGLHPVMTAMKDLYDRGWVSVVQGVGYENLNQSHFKGTDLWLSGGDGTPDNFNIRTGWMGRTLNAMYPDVMGAPTPEFPDPLGIQVGDPYPSLGFHTETEHLNSINLSGQDPEGFYTLIQSIGGAPLVNVPDSEYGDELEFIMGVEKSVDLYSERITETFNAGMNALSYPDTDLSNQLKTVARLIKGGCRTKIFLCSMGGFDTHGSQTGDSVLLGQHPGLLENLSESVKAFLDDLDAMGLAEQVMACTFSEFGRCARENGSYGTDHGTLAPMLIFGKGAESGVVGTNVNMGNVSDDGQLQGQQYDYRQVFTTLVQDWLGANNYALEQAMFDGYNKLPLVGAAYVVSPDCYIGESVSVYDPFAVKRRLSVFPNPATTSTEIAFRSDVAFPAMLTLHSLGGQLVSSGQVQVQPGPNLYYLNVHALPAGPYFVRLENRLNGAAEVARISVVRG